MNGVSRLRKLTNKSIATENAVELQILVLDLKYKKTSKIWQRSAWSGHAKIGHRLKRLMTIYHLLMITVETERGTKENRFIFSRLCMTNTVHVWIQSDSIETFLCWFFLIFFGCHLRWGENQVTKRSQFNARVSKVRREAFRKWRNIYQLLTSMTTYSTINLELTKLYVQSDSNLFFESEKKN